MGSRVQHLHRGHTPVAGSHPTLPQLHYVSDCKPKMLWWGAVLKGISLLSLLHKEAHHANGTGSHPNSQPRTALAPSNTEGRSSSELDPTLGYQQWMKFDRHEEADEQLKRLRPPSAPPSTPRTTPAFEFHIRHGLQNSKYGVGSCSAQAVLVSPRAFDAGTQRECAARGATEQRTHTYDPPLTEGCMSAVQGARELKYVAVNDEGEFLRRTHLHGCSGTCSDSWRHDGRLACNTALRHAMGFAPALQ